jgi:hypothetical protein
MRAVVRLVWSYFTPLPLLSAVSALAVILTLGALIHLWLGPHSSDVYSLLLPVVAIAALYVGSLFMPLMAGRLARSHYMHLLPSGRTKLLASVFVTIALVSFVAPFFWALGNWSMSEEVAKKNGLATVAQYHDLVLLNFATIYTSAILMTGWLYLALWFITAERTAAGFVKGLVVLLLALYSPTLEIQTLETSLVWNLVCLGTVWSLVAIGFLNWQRIGKIASRRAGTFSGSTSTTRNVAGREIDLLLGTANPWLLSAALIVPALLAAKIGDYSPAVWLFYLTIFSTVSGAIAGQAASRSRALWLRTPASRAELFGKVELSFWRHNSCVLATLMVLMLLIGRYANLPASLLAMGLPLLILGTTASTYLGLMVTRGLGWMESTLGVSLMVMLMTIAVLAASSRVEPRFVVTLELLLAVAALALRFIARARWAGIDWSQCRPERFSTSRDA